MLEFVNIVLLKGKECTMKLAIIGATGMVGVQILKILQERKFSYTELILVASEKSIGTKIIINNQSFTVTGLQEMILSPPRLGFVFCRLRNIKNLGPKISRERL